MWSLSSGCARVECVCVCVCGLRRCETQHLLLKGCREDGIQSAESLGVDPDDILDSRVLFPGAAVGAEWRDDELLAAWGHSSLLPVWGCPSACACWFFALEIILEHYFTVHRAQSAERQAPTYNTDHELDLKRVYMLGELLGHPTPELYWVIALTGAPSHKALWVYVCVGLHGVCERDGVFVCVCVCCREGVLHTNEKHLWVWTD